MGTTADDLVKEALVCPFINVYKKIHPCAVQPVQQPQEQVRLFVCGYDVCDFHLSVSFHGPDPDNDLIIGVDKFQFLSLQLLDRHAIEESRRCQHISV
jgi:hypothetical protein